ncbi:hypothetical protein C8R48DRAFT_754190 [Suillus tomentosus]|nr:hypothetical protein C8R48DRAFT_754190 [Suillus tomentosus]
MSPSWWRKWVCPTPNVIKSETVPDLIIHHSGNAVPEYKNPSFFPGMYPTLYPYGIGGFEIKSRPTALAFHRQAQYCLSISDRSFRYHNSFLFVVLNILQRRQAHLQTHFSRLASQLERECKLSNLTSEEKSALALLQQVNTLSARIPGSQASKIFVRNEIRNYFGYFGLPHIFFTFNPSATHSPIFQVMYGDNSIDLSSRFPTMPTGPERAARLAHFFEFSFKCLFRDLFGWDFDHERSSESGGILGRIRAFYGTTEPNRPQV